MTKISGHLLLWAPRVLGVLTCLFLGLFALDAFTEEKTLASVSLQLAPPSAASHTGSAFIVTFFEG